MKEIIPTIIAKDFQEVQEKIKKVEPYVDWVQLDIMDGKFVDNKTWDNPSDLKELETDLNLEVHLMVSNPEEAIDNWANSGVKRIIFHYESTDRHKEIIEKIKKAGLDVFVAINPETSIEVLEPFLRITNYELRITGILIMTVNPGFGGQEFLEENLEKISQLRNKYKNANIEVDGGINLENASKVIQAGANLLAVGTTIFESNNIKETIKELKQDADN